MARRLRGEGISGRDSRPYVSPQQARQNHCPSPARTLRTAWPSVCLGTSPGAGTYGAVYSTSGGQWHVAPFPITTAESATAPFSQNLLTCPGSRTCYALSLNAAHPATLARSADGGLRWQPIVLPFQQAEPLSPYFIPGMQAACMSDNACVFAVPQGFAATLDGGSSWVNTTLYSSLPAPGGLPAHGQLNNYLAGVACPAVRVCFVTVETVERSRGHESSTTWLFSTHDAGRRWSRRPIGPLTVRATGLSLPIFAPGSFACADALHCVLVAPEESRGPARVLLTANGGATFFAASASTGWGQGDITVTCVARLVCWALPLSEGLRAIWRSADGGRHWAEASPLPRGMAFGAAPFRYSGAPPEPGSVACPSAEGCVAIAHRPSLGALQPNVFVSTTDGGRTWGVENIPALPASYRPRPPIVD